MKRYIFATILFAMFLMIPVSHEDLTTYGLKTDGRTFDLGYEFDGSLISMDVDKQSTSLLVGIKDVKDSQFTITIPPDLLNAQNGEFIVLVDGFETDYSLSYKNNVAKISFPIPDLSEEVEIIGTSVIPEFPFGSLAILGAVVAMMFIFSSRLKNLGGYQI